MNIVIFERSAKYGEECSFRFVTMLYGTILALLDRWPSQA